MAARGVAGAHAHRSSNGTICAVEGARGSNAAAGPSAAARAPAHRFRPGKFPHHLGQDVGHDLRRRASRALDARDIERALAVLLDDALCELTPACAGSHRAPLPAHRCAGLCAPRACRAPHRRQIFDRQRQPARRRKGPRASVPRGPPATSTFDHQPEQILARALLHPGRNFLREKLEQKLGHQPLPRPSGCVRHRRPRSWPRQAAGLRQVRGRAGYRPAAR